MEQKQAIAGLKNQGWIHRKIAKGLGVKSANGGASCRFKVHQSANRQRGQSESVCEV